MKKNVPLKVQVNRLRDFTEKVTLLDASGDANSFRTEFGSNWRILQVESKYKHERYNIRLQHLATKYAFEKTELISLEQYLQEGKELLLTRDAGASDEERLQYRSTRDWETVDLARHIIKMRKQGMKYKEIVAHYNHLLNENGYTERVTAESLRKVMSRTDARLEKNLENLICHIL